MNAPPVESPPAGRPLACCVEVPSSFESGARYALAMLLLPLGIDPVYVGRDALPAGGIYYGPAGNAPADHPGPALAFDASAAAFFDRPPERARLRPETIREVAWDGERWPLPFGEEGAEDLVASAFFWLSGWQEYATPERDEHGRFPFAASLQSALGTAVRPAVDAYRELLAARLAAHGVPLARRRWGGRAWALCPTHDVDYLRKWRPGLVYREVVEYLLRNRRGVGPAARVRRFGRFARDWLQPGDRCRAALERMPREVAARGGTATYFLKTAARDPHDVPYATTSRYLRRRVESLLSSGFEVGLHPSYRAHADLAFLREERDRLVALTGASPRSVRQHYLRYELPTTPRLHAALAFGIDSTLGFAEQEGFRHATCHPFRLYDLEADRPLDLWEMPLAIMESTLFNRRQLDAAGARAATESVLAAVRRFGGASVVLWHNTLWDELDYPGWGRHFLETLDRAVEERGRIASLHAALSEWRPAEPERENSVA